MNIIGFWKPSEIPYGVFSQWYNSSFIENNIIFNNCEQYMMYHKAKLFNDIEKSEEILQNNDPKVLKEIGKLVKNFNQKIWDSNKYQIVLEGNLLKFSQNKKLKIILKSTNYYEIVEASPFDKIWGIGTTDTKNRNKWNGENLLGKVLMDVRNRL